MRPPSPTFNFEHDRYVLLDGESYAVQIESGERESTVVAVNGRNVSLSSKWRPGEPVWFGIVDGERVSAIVTPILNGVHVSHGGVSADIRVYTQREAELIALMPEKTEAETGKQLLCPMPGLIKAIYVQAGQEIKIGEPLCIVEAMKMENVLRAERDTKVTAIHAKQGDSLAVDEVIMEFT